MRKDWRVKVTLPLSDGTKETFIHKQKKTCNPNDLFMPIAMHISKVKRTLKTQKIRVVTPIEVKGDYAESIQRELNGYEEFLDTMFRNAVKKVLGFEPSSQTMIPLELFPQIFDAIELEREQLALKHNMLHGGSKTERIRIEHIEQ